MARKVKVYLSRTCMTSKRAVSYLKTKGFKVEEIDYHKVRLTKEEISEILTLARVTPKEALRKKDRMYKELNLADRDLYNDEILGLMEKHPGLIQRPIVVIGDKACIARETSKIASML